MSSPVDPFDAITRLIRIGRERRNVEFKEADAREPFIFSNSRVRETVARTAMAMANIGGGTIIIGMRESSPGVWEASGASETVRASYNQDVVQQYVNSVSDPFVDLEVIHHTLDGRNYIAINVSPFDEMPVICKGGSGNPLRQGTIYTRSMRLNATEAIQSQNEMRDLLNRAIKYGVDQRMMQVQPLFDALTRIIGPQFNRETDR